MTNRRNLDSYEDIFFGEDGVPLFFVHNLVNSETGKTYKQENLELRHNIPLGTLVEVEWDDWFGDGACWAVHARLWVVEHRRDCDGTPLYSLSRWRNPAFPIQVSDIHHGFGEESLTPVELTREVLSGEYSLEARDES